MRRKFLSAVLVLFTLTAGVFAQSDDGEWFWNQPIKKVEFEGLRNVKRSDLTGIASSFINRPFTEDTYNDILDRLYSLDMFDEITPYAKHLSPKTNDVLLVFQVVESPVIKSIIFQGNKKVRNSELKDQIKIKTSDVYVESKVLVDERLLRNYYISEGYTASTVTHEINKSDDGVTVIFKINEGSRTAIKTINFSGNVVFSSRTLKSKIKSQEAGLFRKGSYQASTVEQDKAAIISYYRERGYADADILDVKIDTVFNEKTQGEEITMTFVIQEGSQYIFTGLSLRGNEVFSTEELLSLCKIKAGSVYNDVKFQEAVQAIASKYYEDGYMENEFYPIPVKDTERHEISYDFLIREHARSHIENIIIKGNTKTKDYVIRREIPIEEGDIFSREKIITALRNLMNLQYFSTVVPDYQSGSESNLVDLVFSVEEQSTTTLQFGLTFSGTSDPNNPIPISGFLKFENSNLFGEGRSGSVSLNLSTTEQSIDFAYSQGWIGSLPISFTQSISFSHATTNVTNNMWLPDNTLLQPYYYMSYEGWSASLGTALGRRWTPDFAILTATMGMTDSLTNNIYNEAMYVPVDQGISSFANRWGIVNSVYGSFSIDDRDVNYYPTSGYFASEKVAWYGLIPVWEKEFFLRSDTVLESYLKLFEFQITDNYSLKMILAANTSFTAIFPVNSSITDSNKVYIDGTFNGRGWSEIYRTNRGLSMLSNKIELRLPVIPGVVGVDGFFDVACVKATPQEMFTSLKAEDFYFSYGPAVRFLVSQLPLDFLFAFKMQIENGQLKYADNPFQFVLSFNVINK